MIVARGLGRGAYVGAIVAVGLCILAPVQVTTPPQGGGGGGYSSTAYYRPYQAPFNIQTDDEELVLILTLMVGQL